MRPVGAEMIIEDRRTDRRKWQRQ